MAGVKRALDDEVQADTTGSATISFIPQFEFFRAELDDHHDRRERIVKASRDITALSKKTIFSLQRYPLLPPPSSSPPIYLSILVPAEPDDSPSVRTLAQPLPPPIYKEITARHDQITTLFTSIAPDLAGPNFYRYARQISPGIQEYIEALTFQHYLTTCTLLPLSSAQEKLPGGVVLTYDDYLLGIFDLVGELMRFAITGMATMGQVITRGSEGGRQDGGREGGNEGVVNDLRRMRAGFEGLDVRDGYLGRDVERKREVMRSCVEEVEGAVYGMIVRGRERPSGWVPEMSGGGRGEGQEVVG